MKFWLLFAFAALGAAPALTQPQPPAPPISPDFLQGRWCETAGSGWMTVDAATRQINLPNGNTGQRVVGRYQLNGSTLIITGPGGNPITVSLRRVDAQSMTFNYGRQSSLVRRCAGEAGTASSGSRSATTEAALDPTFLQGRWCAVTGNEWTRFDTAAQRIDLPNGNTGTRVVAAYRLDGSRLLITGPAGGTIEATLRRVDQQSLEMGFGGQVSLARRC